MGEGGRGHKKHEKQRTLEGTTRLRTWECTRIQPQEPADDLAAKQTNQHAGITNTATCSHDGNPTRMLQKRWERLGKRWECK